MPAKRNEKRNVMTYLETLGQLATAAREDTAQWQAARQGNRNAALNIERQALKMLAGVGSRTTETHVEQMSDPSGQSAMKRENMAEERRPSELAI